MVDTDFQSSVWEMTFIGDQRKSCAQIQIIDDTVAEGVEYFHVFLQRIAGVKFEPSLASIKIADDDGKVHILCTSFTWYNITMVVCFHTARLYSG